MAWDTQPPGDQGQLLRDLQHMAGLDHPKPRSSHAPTGVAMGVCFPAIHSAEAPKAGTLRPCLNRGHRVDPVAAEGLVTESATGGGGLRGCCFEHTLVVLRPMSPAP